jgi:hypothetical protein
MNEPGCGVYCLDLHLYCQLSTLHSHQLWNLHSHQGCINRHSLARAQGKQPEDGESMFILDFSSEKLFLGVKRDMKIISRLHR